VRLVDALYEYTNDDFSAIFGLFQRLGRGMVMVDNVVDNADYLFQFEPRNIPFASFKVMDEDDLYCIGCVFSLEDVKKELGVSND
jgi:hypothetical protein